MKNLGNSVFVLTLVLSLLGLQTQAQPNRLKDKAEEALAYCNEAGYSTDLVILIDMKIHSGKERFFVYDFKGDSILDAGVVSHGCGQFMWGGDDTKESPVFSNTPDSHLSSLGKYKVGKRGWSNWGINVNYKLHGLESTNNKAYKRVIVLHSWDAVPEMEVYPNGCPEGWGCPAVANDFMRRLDKRLQLTSKPVLLWIYQ